MLGAFLLYPSLLICPSFPLSFFLDDYFLCFLYQFNLFIHYHGINPSQVWVGFPLKHFVPVLCIFSKKVTFKPIMCICPIWHHMSNMFGYYIFRIILVVPSCEEHILHMIEAFFLCLCGVFHKLISHLETAWNEISLLIFNQWSIKTL